MSPRGRRAIALVELSVLVYDDIGTIGKTAAKLRDPRLKRSEGVKSAFCSLLRSIAKSGLTPGRGAFRREYRERLDSRFPWQTWIVVRRLGS